MQSHDIHYKIHYNDLEYGKKLGEVTFGEVFEGTWQYSQVTIKKHPLQTLSSEAYSKAYQALATEAKIIADLRNPNVIQFYGICYGSSHLEYMLLGALYALSRSVQDFDWVSRVQISSDAGAGLVYLHNKPMLYRNIKSLNVLLRTKENELHAKFKLTDAGPSNIKSDTKPTSSTAKDLSDTLAWKAPELFARRVSYKDAHDSKLISGLVRNGKRDEIVSDTSDLFKKATYGMTLRIHLKSRNIFRNKTC